MNQASRKEEQAASLLDSYWVCSSALIMKPKRWTVSEPDGIESGRYSHVQEPQIKPRKTCLKSCYLSEVFNKTVLKLLPFKTINGLILCLIQGRLVVQDREPRKQDWSLWFRKVGVSSETRLPWIQYPVLSEVPIQTASTHSSASSPLEEHENHMKNLAYYEWMVTFHCMRDVWVPWTCVPDVNWDAINQ
jgi:hypothetical protein